MAVKSRAGEDLAKDVWPSRRKWAGMRPFIERMIASVAGVDGFKSLLGPMLERAQMGVDGSMFIRDDADLFRATHVATDQAHARAIYALVWGALSTEEQAVIVLRYVPIGYEYETVDQRLSDAREGDGSELIKLCRGEDGEFSDMGTFRVLRPLYANDSDIATLLFDGWCGFVVRYVLDGELVPMSTHQVRERLRSAHDTIAGHAVFRQMRNGE